MKKIVTVLLIGCMACIAFAGVCRYVATKEEKVEIMEMEQSQEPTLLSVAEPPRIQATIAPKHDIEEAVVVMTMEPEKVTEAPFGEEEQIDELATKVPPITTTEVPKPQSEELTEVQKESTKPSATAVPTTEPTQVPITTPLPIQQIQAPQIQEPPVEATLPPKEEEVHVHDFEKAVWEEPTCEKGGYYNNICKVCGLEESVSQEPLPHVPEDIIVQEGNCMEDRIIRHVCKNCGIQVESDTRYPLYDVHQWSMEEVDGIMLKYCERCGVVE